MEEKKTTIKAYKGFDKDLKCRDFQYEIGKTYTMDENEVSICNKGFHAIDADECPLSIFSYYPPASSRYCEVEIGGRTDKSEEKIVGSEISVGAEIGIPVIVKAHTDWVKQHLIDDNEHKSFNTGYCSSASNTGYCSSASNTGNYSSASNTGYCSSASNTGNYSSASNMGYCSSASNTGNYSSAKVSGKDSVAIATGYRSKAKGAMGCAIVVAERGEWNGETYPLINICSAIVDGEKIKPDTWYTAKNGQLVEVESNN
ncbi:MAG: hypothetical protein IJU19_00665 [Bacteroidales bacterium]|nr:hypothetical protein [Bacteroidales bacterium]